jgi:hypothetical protein
MVCCTGVDTAGCSASTQQEANLGFLVTRLDASFSRNSVGSADFEALEGTTSQWDQDAWEDVTIEDVEPQLAERKKRHVREISAAAANSSGEDSSSSEVTFEPRKKLSRTLPTADDDEANGSLKHVTPSLQSLSLATKKQPLESEVIDDDTFPTPLTWTERRLATKAASLKSTPPISIASGLTAPSTTSNPSVGSVASSYHNSTGGRISLSLSPPKPEVKKPASRPGTLVANVEAFKKLLTVKFHDDEATIIAENMGTPLTAPTGLHIFVDLSNILIGLKKFIDEHPHLAMRGAPTPTKSTPARTPGLDFDTFSLLMERGRPAAKRFVLGSWPIHRSDMFNRTLGKARKRGYETTIWQKVQRLPEGPQLMKPSGPQRTLPKAGAGWMEQGVDEGIQLKMADSLLFEEPQVMVIATGDGAKSTLGPGFAKYVEKALELGWHVELLAWSKSASLKYRDVNWQFQWQGRFRFVDLGDFAQHLLVQPSAVQKNAGKQ